MSRPRKEVVEDLNVAILAAGHTMRSASLALGLNHAYLSQFMKETDYSPEVLPEEVREGLAQLLGMNENNLRVSTQKRVKINPKDTIQPYGRNANGTQPHKQTRKRTTDMRVDDVMEQLGRIKERLDRLEGQTDTNPASRKDKKDRPL